MYLLIIKEGETLFFLIGPTRGFTKEAEGKERDDGSCEKLQKT